MPNRLIAALFPTLKGARWLPIDLAVCAKEWLKNVPIGENPLLDPQEFDSHLKSYHRQRGVDFSYGGYLEDRSELLRGAYMVKKGKPLHLGIDINVPSGTPLYPAVASKVLVVDDDADIDCGWGPRMILVPSDQKSSAISVVYAHLADITPKVGDVILPDQCVARIGAAPKNGNWFPHLHVQLIRTDYLFQLLGQPEVSRGPVGGASQLEMLDGYGAKEDLAILRERFPDPLKDFPW